MPILPVACGAGGSEESDHPTGDVEFLVPYSPGGGYDSWARLLAPFVAKHLPNDVEVIVKSAPGAGGQRAANREGSSEARLSVIRGDADASIYPLEGVLENFRAGELTPMLYIGKPLEEGATGYEEAQEVRTVTGIGYPELRNLEAPRVIGAPPDLPDDIGQVLDNAIRDALADPEFLKKAEENQLTPFVRNAAKTVEIVNETLDTLSGYGGVLTGTIQGQ